MAARTKLARVLTTLTARTTSSNSRSMADKFSRSLSSAAVATQESGIVGSRYLGLETLGVKDYEDYRRSLYGEITHKAVLVDAVGTLVLPSQPMAEVGFLSLLISIHEIQCFSFCKFTLISQIYCCHYCLLPS